MKSTAAEQLVRAFENGALSRRELAARLMGLGAAVAASQTAFGDEQAAGDQQRGASHTFQATALDHVALNVTDVARSREFYSRHLGMTQVGGDAQRRAFMAPDEQSGFFLALFAADSPGLNHHAYAIRDYDPDRVVEKLRAANLQPRREQDRVYFPDPDGITVQVTGT